MSTRARNAVAVSFLLNGFGFASWVSRIPETRARLHLDNGQLGLLLLCISVGSLAAMPSAGVLIDRLGTAAVVRVGTVADVAGLVVVTVGVAAWQAWWLTGLGLLVYGLGVGIWDVAMNVEGAAVEQRLGRTVMPRFHAAFSGGTVLAAGVGALAELLGVPIWVHLPVVALLLLAGSLGSVGRFLPEAERVAAHGPQDADDASFGRSRAWLERRTLLVGVMVLALALTEGTANDWLAVALQDGYDAPRWLAVTGFAGFVSAMTLGRLVGPGLLDRFGRVSVLWATMAAAAVGVLLIVFGGQLVAGPVLVVAGIVLWGVGASLGFPVGMSAAADEPRRAAARVSVVSTIGYTAFLAGPPLLGFVGNQVGTLRALLVVAVLLVPAAIVVPAARQPRS
ncbi:MFS transporter [Nocardioides mangrovicus]|uniref:MFS transporter n=1 Tax=Nocardioides mangrovicus TaxID=2478913 RepID=A0A3L8P8I5_9ACTN|nr:MFS transporter [Nocardioides mangrovicus]RLV51039.1 MFS transporter [Nocardioides mangrovicus]